MVGCQEVSPGLFKSADDGGTFSFFERSGVVALSASGAALASLRGQRLYGDYLSAIAYFPHRVTTLHATRDSAEYAPPVVAAVRERALAGKISLTRKAVSPEAVQWHFSRNGRGDDTGTVYLGSPNVEVRAVVYDKQHERVCKGMPDPGPTLRIEMRLKKVGAGLRDAFDCASLFYHYAAPSLCDAPAGVAAWAPHGEGFSVTRSDPLPPAARLRRLIETSPDFARALELAHECGPQGVEWLLHLLRQAAEGTVVTPTSDPAMRQRMTPSH